MENLIFKTGGVDACRCGELLHLIEQEADTSFLITHRAPLRYSEGYRVFEKRLSTV
ncbi:MAG: hypothetical protein ACLRXC_12530 [[Clostridium] leptum]